MTNTMPTIWIVNEAGHSYHKAKDAVPDAELRPLTVGNVNPLAIDRLAYEVSRGITKMSKPDDYILIAGTPVLNALVMTLWILHHGVCQFLQWDAKNREYRLFTFERVDLEELLERQMLR